MFLFFAFAIGCQDGKSSSEPSSDRYQEGYDDGYEEGFGVGYDSGEQQGYQEGQQDGYDSGFQQGYDSGYTQGYDDGSEVDVEPGWDLYASGDYEGACSSFFYQASQFGFELDIAIGLGWCHLRQVEPLLAASWFELAIAIDESSQDAWVGLGSASMLLNDFDLTAHAIDQALVLDPNYSCAFESIDSTSLQVAQILVLLFAQDTAGVSIYLSELDPNHGLVAIDSSSWVVDSIEYSSFQRAVIAKLQAL